MSRIPRLLLPHIAVVVIVVVTDAFSPGASSTLVNLSPAVDRGDVYAMSEWAANYGGVQQAGGVGLTSYDGYDYFQATQLDMPAGTCITYVPSDLVISSSKALREFGKTLSSCEKRLTKAGVSPDAVPLFRVFFKILAEYEKGDQSPWFPWLDSLPKSYNNGASMTYDCFDILPPYASYCAMQDRLNLLNFQKAVRPLGGPSEAPFGPNVLEDEEVLKWAYNVARTRSIEADGDCFIAPMCDMFNHGANPEAEVTYDPNTGDCYAYAIIDVPAGSPLRISYGDPTNTTPLFANYGFLDDSAPGTFCKLLNMLKEMEELGYGFSDLLFYKDGDISPGVYDVVLYHVLKKGDDPGLAQGFYQATMNGDESTKAQYQEIYWPYTKEELLNHVNGMIDDIERSARTARSYDLNTHPRVPLILQHNSFVRDTFVQVKSYLDNM